MKNRNIILSLLLLIFLTFEISCNKSVGSESSVDGKEVFRIWALADIQPRDQKEKDSFSAAVNDVNQNIKDIKFSIVAGDIVNTTDEETFDWYVAERDKSYINTWYEIIGNHDLKSDRGTLFKEKLRDDLNYSVTYGNMLFIFLSDELRGKPTEVTDEVFQWWKDLVLNNQDKIITVVTHAPLQGSKIPFSKHQDRHVVDSERFREVLKEYTVDLWLSGHLHLPNEFTNTVNRNNEFDDTLFVHISSIRPEFLGLKHSQSRVLEFICEENMIRIKSRDHKSGKWNKEIEKDYKLSKVVECP